MYKSLKKLRKMFLKKEKKEKMRIKCTYLPGRREVKEYLLKKNSITSYG